MRSSCPPDVGQNYIITKVISHGNFVGRGMSREGDGRSKAGYSDTCSSGGDLSDRCLGRTIREL